MGVLPQVIHNILFCLPIIAAGTDDELLRGDGRRTERDVGAKGKLPKPSRFNLTRSIVLSKMLVTGTCPLLPVGKKGHNI